MSLRLETRPLVVVLVGLLGFGTAWGAAFSGECVGVKDGDTIEVMHDGRAEVVRLHGVDCPEKGQDFGTRAREFTGDLAFGKVVSVEKRDKDRYGRTVGVVTLPDGRSLNEALVREGYAWWYRQYAPKDKALESAEKEARQAKAGLWSQGSPVAPWEYRKLERDERAKKREAKSETPAPARNAEDRVYVTKTGGKYHGETCKRLRKTRTEMSRREAEAQGYEPCSVCDP